MASATIMLRPVPVRTHQSPPVIDILVLYTEAVENELARRNRGIEREIAFVEHMQNRIFEVSGVIARVRLSARRWSEFDESKHVPAHLKCDPSALNCAFANIQINLLREIELDTRNGDTYSIAKYRKVASADLVSLWLWRAGWDTTGSAASGLKRWHFTAGAPSASSTSFLNLVVAEKAWLWWHFAHELGHNLGLADDGDDSADSIKPDAFGYVDEEFPFRTIMAGDRRCKAVNFAACMRIPMYSNSDAKFTYFGRRVGSTTANAVTTLNLTAAFVASYSDFLK